MYKKFLYFDDSYQFVAQSSIESVQKDERGPYIILDNTIFYPQGGGQPSDQGYLNFQDTNIEILHVKLIDKEIRHYTDADYSHLIGQRVNCHVNQDKRILHIKLHTSGHLISNILESLYPEYKAIKGHHFPNECYVEFTTKEKNIEDININLVNQKINDFINENQPVETKFINYSDLEQLCPNHSFSKSNDQQIRIVRIGNFSYQPCGGLHVKMISELIGLKITKSKIKNNTLKISYLIEE